MDMSWTGLACVLALVVFCLLIVLAVIWTKRYRRRLSDLEKDYDDGPRRRDER